MTARIECSRSLELGCVEFGKPLRKADLAGARGGGWPHRTRALVASGRRTTDERQLRLAVQPPVRPARTDARRSSALSPRLGSARSRCVSPDARTRWCLRIQCQKPGHRPLRDLALSRGKRLRDQAGRRSLPTLFTITAGGSKMPTRSNNPMQPERLAKAWRCLAKIRKGTECQSPAVKGKRRCRMHGGTNPGPPEGNRSAWKHGAHSTAVRACLHFLKTVGSISK